MNLRRPILMISVLLLIAIGLGRIVRKPDSGSPSTPRFVTVQSLELGREFQEFGILEPKVIGRVLAPFQGTVSWMERDGITVTNGAPLFRVDDDTLRDQIESGEESLQTTKEQLDTLREDFTVLTNTYTAKQEQELEELAFATLEYDTAVEGMKPADRRLKEIDILLAKIAVQDAQTLYDRQKILVQKNFASEVTLESNLRSLQSAQALLAEIELQFKLALAPIQEEQRLTLDAKVKQAQRVVERSREKHERELSSKKLEIEAKEKELYHLDVKQSFVTNRLNQISVTAPTNGVFRVIRRINRAAGNWQKLSTGVSVEGQNVIGEIIDPGDMLIESLIHETDAVHVKTGMPVHIQLTAYPRIAFSGEVLRTTSLAQDRSDLTPVYRKVPAAKQAMLKAVISLESNGHIIQPGMSAQIHFELEPTRPRLVVPRHTVRLGEGTYSVQDERGNEVPVQGRFRDDGWFEVTDGLQEGDRIRFPSEDLQ